MTLSWNWGRKKLAKWMSWQVGSGRGVVSLPYLSVLPAFPLCYYLAPPPNKTQWSHNWALGLTDTVFQAFRDLSSRRLGYLRWDMPMTKSQQLQPESNTEPICPGDSQPQTEWKPIQLVFLFPLSNQDWLTSYTSSNSLPTTFDEWKINS